MISIMYDSHLLSIVKACSWRFFGSVATGGLVYVFTGNMAAAVSVGGLEALAKIFLYYAHERLWHFLAIKGMIHKRVANEEARGHVAK